jgi:HEPN domain-containing protein
MATKLIKPDKPFWMFSMEADTDYLLCRMINFLGSSFHARAGFFAQQACEKYMKALTIQDRSEYTEINNLVELAKFCEPIDPYFAEKNTITDLQQLRRGYLG